MKVVADSVRIYTLYDDEQAFGPNYVKSMYSTIGYDLGSRGRIAVGGWAFKHAKGYDLAAARNECAAELLTSDVEWMLFVDSDMGWDADAVDRLMAVADPEARPIVGGLCFGFSPYANGYGQGNGPHRYPFPTIYDREFSETKIGFKPRYHYAPAALQAVGATGAAFLLIHRGALATIQAKYGDEWFSRTRVKHPTSGEWSTVFGEDVSFCVRAADCGIPIHVDSRVRVSHLKPVYVTELTFTEWAQPSPADEEIDVIVPVLGRPHHAEPFMRSLRATTGLASVTAVANEGDDETIAAWRRNGATVIHDEGRTTFAEKVNDAYAVTERPWLLLVGSDVVFRPSWWDHALVTARATGASVVATNDLLNADVQNGRLATHPVMRRDYIREQGASWDGPDLVTHEGYRHWYVDAEWSAVAIQRGVFATAPAAVVEHMHPIAGKAESDEVYELGAKHRKSDAALFAARCKRFAKAA